MRILLIAMMVAAAPASAQVLEIGDDGEVATYSASMLFTDDGASPLEALPAPSLSVLDSLATAAREQGVDPGLLSAVAWQESRFRPDALSAKGATGIMQLMPGTARDLGVDPRDPAQNIKGGAAYLAQMLKRFGSTELALAAYNAGPGAVEKHRGVPPYVETRAYVRAVLARAAATPKLAGSAVGAAP